MQYSKTTYTLLCIFSLAATTALAQTTVSNKGTDITNRGNTIYLGSYINGTSPNARVANSGTIYIKDSLVNTSPNHVFVTRKGKVVFNGEGLQVISGDSSVHFNQLEVNNPFSELRLNQNIQVSDSLIFTKGSIFLNGNVIDLDTAGILVGESNSNRVYGRSGAIKTRRFIDHNRANLSENLAGLGLYLSTKEQFGYVLIERGHQEQVYAGDTSIYRYFSFTPVSNATGLIDSLKIAYFDWETIAGESNYKIYSSVDNGVEWRNKGGFVDTANNFIVTTTVSPPEIGKATFSIFSTENFATCQPNDPNYISAIFLVATTVLNGDSTHFVQLTAPAPTTYTWNFGDGTIDNSTYSPYHRYYLIDDSTASEFPVTMTVTNGLCSDTRKKIIRVVPRPPLKLDHPMYAGLEWVHLYPNPAQQLFHLEVKSVSDEEVTIRIVNVQGETLEERKVMASQLNEAFDLSHYTPGMYFVKLQLGEEMRVVKLVRM